MIPHCFKNILQTHVLIKELIDGYTFAAKSINPVVICRNDFPLQFTERFALLILIEVLGTIAQQERQTIHERQREGITAAKAKGVTFGRPAATKPENWDSVMESWHNGNITAKKAMELTGTKRTTFYKLAGTK